MAERYRSDALAAVHESALGLAEAGVMAERTMRSFDEMCLTPVEDLALDEIRGLPVRQATGRTS